MAPEIIILGSFGLVIGYIFLQSSITSKKMKKKITTPAKDKGKETVELKTVIAPKPDEKKLQEDYMKSEYERMKRAAQESIEEEKRWKSSLLEEESKKEQAKTDNKQTDLDKKLKEMQNKIDEINFTPEEQTFVDEVQNLSPELKAILFADILNRKGY